MTDVLVYEIPEGTRPAKCRGPNCGATVYWLETKSGAKMIVNPDGIPHWGTCPDRFSFKKNRGRKK